MKEAIALAWESAGHTRPNPPVGAVVVKDGRIIGRGRHVRCGMAHAEVAALADCKANGYETAGATVYVTLEPCSRPGRVGACTDALIAAKVKKVVWACQDPNPVNRGRAAKALASCGVETEEGLLADEAADLIKPFAKFTTQKLPFVTVKIAMSLDGKICDNSGVSRWISSESSLAKTRHLRDVADVMLVGAETVRLDNPSLLAKDAPNNDLYRAVVTNSGNLPPNAQIFTDAAKDRTLVYKSTPLRDVMADLASRNFMHVVCEGGMNLARSLAAEGLVDEWIAVLCPIVIGNAPLAEAFRLPGEDVVAKF